MALAPKNHLNPKRRRATSRRLGILHAMVPFLRPHRSLISLAMLVLCVTTAASLITPLIVRRLVDDFDANSLDLLNQYFWVALVIAVFQATANALRFFLLGRLAEQIVVDIRKAVFDRVITMSPAFYEKIMTGEVVSRITTDTTLVQSIMGSMISMLLRNVLVLGGGLVLLFMTSVKLTIMVLLVVPFMILPVRRLGRKMRQVSREAQDWIAASSGNASERLVAVQTVQSFTHETASKATFSGLADASLDAGLRKVTIRAFMSLVVTSLTFTSVIIVLWVGALDVQKGIMTLGALVQFTIYAVMVSGTVTSLSQFWGELQRATGATERLVELLQAEDTVVDLDDVKQEQLNAPIKGQIAFESVQFQYPLRPNVAALKNVSFVVNPGETVALVGPSGAGKSTIIQLVQRFYDPITGRITLDGHDLRNLSRQSIRCHIAIVPQEPLIFAASAMDNIRFGNPEATDTDVENAARAAAAHDFIAALPDGYDSYLGERGIMLSGGQKQRVAIARAILRDAPILLLDEATSALDAQSERAIQHAVEAISDRTTTIIIAHRLATVKKADRIIVMDEGQIVATGTHNELIASDGLYARLARLQFTDGAVCE